jgi:hypothetical protein
MQLLPTRRYIAHKPNTDFSAMHWRVTRQCIAEKILEEGVG